ncbi:hypothetical protein PR048_020208 [Dryococelus australis]|uniref:Uncharacterized protein n=1 Tax=Dryococelus australis TaxID=614101 RepID=A0ABQ9H5N0_9NEOP|nr:hypothetical protein PR048_020208 [Dryococelus australis]
MPLIGWFSRGSPFFTVLSFRRCSMLTSITFIGSEDLAVKSHPNLLTHAFDEAISCNKIVCLERQTYNKQYQMIKESCTSAIIATACRDVRASADRSERARAEVPRQHCTINTNSCGYLLHFWWLSPRFPPARPLYILLRAAARHYGVDPPQSSPRPGLPPGHPFWGNPWRPKTLYILPQPTGRQSLTEAAWTSVRGRIEVWTTTGDCGTMANKKIDSVSEVVDKKIDSVSEVVDKKIDSVSEVVNKKINSVNENTLKQHTFPFPISLTVHLPCHSHGVFTKLWPVVDQEITIFPHPNSPCQSVFIAGRENNGLAERRKDANSSDTLADCVTDVKDSAIVAFFILQRLTLSLDDSIRDNLPSITTAKEGKTVTRNAESSKRPYAQYASLVGFIPSRPFKSRTPHSPPSHNLQWSSTLQFARAHSARRPPSKTAAQWVAAVHRSPDTSQSQQNMLSSSPDTSNPLAEERGHDAIKVPSSATARRCLLSICHSARQQHVTLLLLKSVHTE